MSALGALVLSLAIMGEVEVSQGAWHGTRMAFEARRCGGSLHSAWHRDDGRLVAEEELDFIGERWSRYRLHRPNVALEVVARRDAEGIQLAIRQGAHRRTLTLRGAESVVAGPALVTHLASLLPLLRSGKTGEFDFLVADQGLVLRLRARASAKPSPKTSTKSSAVAGDGITAVRLEAASPLLRPFVPPTVLQFDARGALLSMEGRLVPQAGDAKNPQSLDGVLRIRPETLETNAPQMQHTCHKGVVS